PVVEVKIIHRAERFVIEAAETQSLFQVFLESVQSVEMRRLRRDPFPARGLEDFLESQVHQQSDLPAYQHANLADVGRLRTVVRQIRRTAIARGPGRSCAD